MGFTLRWAPMRDTAIISLHIRQAHGASGVASQCLSACHLTEVLPIKFKGDRESGVAHILHATGACDNYETMVEHGQRSVRVSGHVPSAWGHWPPSL